jgi:exodeoxyribonuclease-3
VGWRFDYFFVSPELADKVVGFETMTEYYGSDHCPIELTIEV